MAHRIQDGLTFASGTRPPPCYRLVLLNGGAAASGEDVANALDDLLSMLRDLTAGRVRDLAGQPDDKATHSREQFESLKVLLGYGRRFFDDGPHDPPLTRAPRPDFLAYLPRPAPFPALRWVEADAPNTGEADFAVQLAADSEAAVNCAAVECWKLIEDDGLPLQATATFAGFGRHDGRGWLDFHDGVSNIPSGQRLAAIEAAADPPWMAGGTYMAFLRLAVDLGAWRRLDRFAQELVIGRDKRSGAALTAVDRHGTPVAAPADEQAVWRDPPQTTDPLLEASHIHRANQNRASPAAPGGLRMFRQGYDFFDGFVDGAPVLGLNFVSFQSDLRTLQHVLNLPGWLGDVNFGGPSGDASSPRVASLSAGGFYALPPRAKPFPGHDLFV